jgi:hypothetical protein
MHPQGGSHYTRLTCIHMSYGKSLLSILVGRVCNDYTEEKEKKPGELHPATFPDTTQSTQ